MKQSKQLLKFEELQSDSVTRKFKVYSNHSDDFLGTIHWRSGWRCYVISYEPNIDMSVGCNKELNTFVEELETDRKLRLRLLKSKSTNKPTNKSNDNKKEI